MTDEPTLFEAATQAFRDHGLTAAITALIGGSLPAVAASVTRKAFTSEAMLERLDRELSLERERIDKLRAGLILQDRCRPVGADRDRYPCHARHAVRSLPARPHRRPTRTLTTSLSLSPTRPRGGFAFLEIHHADHDLCPFPRRARERMALAQLSPARIACRGTGAIRSTPKPWTSCKPFATASASR